MNRVKLSDLNIEISFDLISKVIPRPSDLTLNLVSLYPEL
jgi:hypothetical protein